MTDHPDPMVALLDAHNVLNDVRRFPDPGDLDLDDAVRIWRTLNDARKILETVCREYGNYAGDLLSNVDYDQRQGYEVDGEPVHHVQRSTDRWDGRGVLGNFLQHVVDANGELIEAVPYDVLVDIIPAVDGTSSRWRTGGLTKHGANPDDFRQRQWQAPTLAPGVKR